MGLLMMFYFQLYSKVGVHDGITSRVSIANCQSIMVLWVVFRTLQTVLHDGIHTHKTMFEFGGL